MVLLDRLGRRWALRMLWELREGPLTFRALREACDGASPSVLSDRLAELRAMEVVEQTAEGYALSRHGRELGRQLLALDDWARAWAARTRRRSKPTEP